MNKPTTDRVKRHRGRMLATGLRPVQIWVPETGAPSIAAERRRQCELIVAADATDAGRIEPELWQGATA